jgi:hypothetical protein
VKRAGFLHRRSTNPRQAYPGVLVIATPLIHPLLKLNLVDNARVILPNIDKRISTLVTDPFGQDDPAHAGKGEIRLSDFGFGLVEPSGEVYGQLTIYYRVAGMIPPESRPKK